MCLLVNDRNGAVGRNGQVGEPFADRYLPYDLESLRVEKRNGACISVGDQQPFAVSG